MVLYSKQPIASPLSCFEMIKVPYLPGHVYVGLPANDINKVSKKTEDNHISNFLYDIGSINFNVL